MVHDLVNHDLILKVEPIGFARRQLTRYLPPSIVLSGATQGLVGQPHGIDHELRWDS